MHIWVAPPGGTEVDMMGIYRLLQSMTRVGARVGSRRELLALLYWYNGLYSIYIDTHIGYVQKLIAEETGLEYRQHPSGD